MQLAGVAILGLGVWVTVDSDSLLGLLDGVENLPDEVFRLAYVGYIMIGVGTALLVIGFLGCCGAIMENRCMLLTVGNLYSYHTYEEDEFTWCNEKYSVPGCFVKLVDWLEENSVIIAGVAMGIAALEVHYYTI
ncbi:hypothetical protein XENOCAPTIV_016333 [Xenoophorus captivus]|uniref:Tetraspanin n=1 Tax=Xenoophorus captivus TaxID=1517983 RepID=A0ABV0RUU6_9TELE